MSDLKRIKNIVMVLHIADSNPRPRLSEKGKKMGQGQDQLRGLALTTIHPPAGKVVMGSTRLGTPFRLSSLDTIVSAI